MDSTTHNIAQMLQLLGALAFVAGIVVAGTGFEAACRRRRPEEIALLLSLTRSGCCWWPSASLLTAAFGLWLVHLGS